MALKRIGTGTAEFGTGDPAIIEKTIESEARVNTALVSYDGKTVVHILSGDHTTVKSVRYGTAMDLSVPTRNSDVSKLSIRASNSDFVKAETIKETYE